MKLLTEIIGSIYFSYTNSCMRNYPFIGGASDKIDDFYIWLWNFVQKLQIEYIFGPNSDYDKQS